MSADMTGTTHLKVTYHYGVHGPSDSPLESGLRTSTVILENCGWPLSEKEFEKIEQDLRKRAWDWADNTSQNATRISLNIVFVYLLRAPDDE